MNNFLFNMSPCSKFSWRVHRMGISHDIGDESWLVDGQMGDKRFTHSSKGDTSPHLKIHGCKSGFSKPASRME